MMFSMILCVCLSEISGHESQCTILKIFNNDLIEI